MSTSPEDAVVVGRSLGDVGKVAEEVIRGNCILFLGAGVHSGPSKDSGQAADVYPDPVRPLRGSELSALIADRTEYVTEFPSDQTTNLGRVSLYAEHKEGFGRPWLYDIIRDNVQTGKQASPMLEALTGLGFRFIATTNYDNLAEQCLWRKGKTPQVVVYNKDRNLETDDYIGDRVSDDPTVMRPFVLKIHGDIDRPDSLVVTDEDYIHFVLRMGDPERFHPVPRSFHDAFCRYSTIFIGYSLLDYNLRLLFKTLRWGRHPARQPKTFSIDPRPDWIIRKVYDNIQFVVHDVWTFVPMLQKEVERRKEGNVA